MFYVLGRIIFFFLHNIFIIKKSLEYSVWVWNV